MAKLQRFRSLKYCLGTKITSFQRTASRGVLSDAYKCEDDWNKRLQSPVFRGLKIDQYFVETDKKFATKRLASGVDIDIFANVVQDETKLDEVEHLLYRFRKTKRSTEIMDSTACAVVRIFLKFKKYDELFRILNDRESYGIFPDMYTFNIMMSNFLKEKLYKEAAQVATLMMLQEDFDNKISCVLGLMSCHMHLSNPEASTETEEQESENTGNDEEDEVYERVCFLRNPWFDDHFDLTDLKHLVGKTCYLLGREIDNTLGRSYQALGLALYEKWDKLHDLITNFSNASDATMFSEAVEKIKEEIGKIPDSEDETRKKILSKFEEKFEKMTSSGLIVDGDLETALRDNLKSVLELEKSDIEAQKKLFDQWEVDRRAALEAENKELDKERRLKAIEEKKEYLYWKEKSLFFFENEESLIEEAKQAEELNEALKDERRTKKIEDEYVVPEIVKQRREKMSMYKKLARVKKIN